jgi:DNA polymerase II
MDDYSLDAVAREVLGEGKAVAGDVRDRIARSPQLPARPRRPSRSMRAPTPAGVRDRAETESRAARLRAQPARRHDAGSGRGEHRILRFSVSDELEPNSASSRPPCAPDDSRLEHAASKAATCSSRSRPAPQCLGVRFQEPVSEHHPHVQHRSAVVRGGSGAGRRSDPHAGGAFRREPAILPRMLDELFPRREAAKKIGDEVASNAIKILMNSFYGVLGTSACRFYNPALANSITGTGREILLWSKAGSKRGIQGALRRHRQFVRRVARRRSGSSARAGPAAGRGP